MSVVVVVPVVLDVEVQASFLHLLLLLLLLVLKLYPFRVKFLIVIKLESPFVVSLMLIEGQLVHCI